MSDLEVRPRPGQDVVVIAPSGTTLLKATNNAAKTRARIKNTGTWVEPTPEPPPVIVPQPKVATFPLGGTPSQLVTLAKDLTVDIIELAAGVYPKWSCFMDVARPADHPLLIRAAGNVVWDGTGTINVPPWYIGWRSLTSNVTWDPGAGSFTIRNYLIGKAGLLLVRDIDTVTFNRVTVRGCEGGYGDGVPGQKQHAHAIYLGAGATRRSRNWRSNGWVVEGPSSRMLNGFHAYTGSSYGCDGYEANGWTVRSLNRAVYAWSNSTGAKIDGWSITDCDATIDNYPNVTTGVVSNMRSVRSGPLAPGQGSWVAGKLTDGGGNVAT